MENTTTPPFASRKRKGKGREKAGTHGVAPVIAAPHDGFSHTIELLEKIPNLRKKVEYIIIRPEKNIDDRQYFYLSDGDIIETKGSQYEIEPNPGMKHSFLDDGIVIMRHTQFRCRSENSQMDSWLQNLHEGVDALAIVTLALNEGHDFKGKAGAIKAAANLPDTFESMPSHYITSKDRRGIKHLLDFIDFMTSTFKAQHELLFDIAKASRRFGVVIEA